MHKTERSKPTHFLPASSQKTPRISANQLETSSELNSHIQAFMIPFRIKLFLFQSFSTGYFSKCAVRSYRLEGRDLYSASRGSYLCAEAGECTLIVGVDLLASTTASARSTAVSASWRTTRAIATTTTSTASTTLATELAAAASTTSTTIAALTRLRP